MIQGGSGLDCIQVAAAAKIGKKIGVISRIHGKSIDVSFTLRQYLLKNLIILKFLEFIIVNKRYVDYR